MIGCLYCIGQKADLAQVNTCTYSLPSETQLDKTLWLQWVFLNKTMEAHCLQLLTRLKSLKYFRVLQLERSNLHKLFPSFVALLSLGLWIGRYLTDCSASTVQRMRLVKASFKICPWTFITRWTIDYSSPRECSQEWKNYWSCLECTLLSSTTAMTLPLMRATTPLPDAFGCCLPGGTVIPTEPHTEAFVQPWANTAYSVAETHW